MISIKNPLEITIYHYQLNTFKGKINFIIVIKLNGVISFVTLTEIYYKSCEKKSLYMYISIQVSKYCPSIILKSCMNIKHLKILSCLFSSFSVLPLRDSFDL